MLVDGNATPRWRAAVKAIVAGDAKCRSIAAASIIAKVTRDRIMADHAATYPGYGWERNRGYPTPEHIRALDTLGLTPLHRRSFAPVRELRPNASLESRVRVFRVTPLGVESATAVGDSTSCGRDSGGFLLFSSGLCAPIVNAVA